MSATAVTVLEAAKATIGEPHKWCKNQFAFDVSGRPVSFGSPDACMWCMMGALSLAALREGASAVDFDEAVESVCRVLGRYNIPVFNDDGSTTHADVMEAFDKAIQTLKVKESEHDQG